MQKKDLIQRAATAFAAALIGRGERADMDKVITWAEALWTRLQARGYGAQEPTGPRESEDWYAKLQGASRQWFDEFWNAFRLKKGRGNAAKRWYQLGDIDEPIARAIIDAARNESARQLEPGQTRKFAEGWLAERRWEDHAPRSQVSVTPVDDRIARARELDQAISHFEKLAEVDKSGAMAKQAEKLRTEKAQLEASA